MTGIAAASAWLGPVLTGCESNMTGAVPQAPVPPPSLSAPNFLYALNTSTIRGQELGFLQEIELAAEVGYDGVEIWINGLQRYLEGGGNLKSLRNQIESWGIEVINAIGFAQWIVDDPSVRAQAMEQAKREMDMLAQIGCTRIAAPPAGATNEPGLDLDRAAERYHELLDLGEKMGVIPQLEVWGFSANLHKLSQVMYVATQSQHPRATILPDVYHLYKGGSGFEGLRLINGAAIDVFHMNDYPALPAREEIGDEHRVFPGDGEAPITQILTDLGRAGGTKILSLELFNREYWAQDASKVAQTGLSKMKAAVAAAAEAAAQD